MTIVISKSSGKIAAGTLSRRALESQSDMDISEAKLDLALTMVDVQVAKKKDQGTIRPVLFRSCQDLEADVDDCQRCRCRVVAGGGRCRRGDQCAKVDCNLRGRRKIGHSDSGRRWV